MSEEIGRLIGNRLIARKDVKALQTPEKGYVRINQPFKRRDMQEHLAGKKSWGHYLLNTDNTTKVFAFDIDVDEELRHVVTGRDDHPLYYQTWDHLHTVAVGLGSRTKRMAGDLGVTTVLSYGGGKGLHVLGIWENPVPASESRMIAEAILGSFNCFHPHRGDIFWKHNEYYPELTIEVFPKQTEIASGGFGNLMRLPLGRNPKTGKEAFLVKPGSTFLQPDDPIGALREGSFR